MDDPLDLLSDIQGGNTGAFFLNTIAPLMDILNDSDEDSLDNTADDVMETISDAYPAEPFRNALDFALIAFFNGSKMNLSMAKIKSIMTMITLLFELNERDNTLPLPKTDYNLHFNERKNTRIPFLTPTKHKGTDKKGDEHDFYMNKPSEYLKFLMADPVKGTQLITLSDHTTCEMKSLQQGSKWRTHESFQQPMITLDNGSNVWFTDLVRVNFTGNWDCILVSNFFTKKEDLNSEYITYFKGFPVKYIRDNAGSNSVAIDQKEWAFPVSSV